MDKPYLTISSTRGIYYIRLMCVSSDGKKQSIRSFGRADDPENWDNAVECLCYFLRKYYRQVALTLKEKELQGGTSSASP